MRKKLIYTLLTVLILAFAATGKAAETSPDIEAVSDDSELIEIEYGGKLIKVDIDDLILMADGQGGQKIDLGYPEKYAGQLENAPLYGVGEINTREDAVYPAYQEIQGTEEITEREYEEERRARRWTEIVEDLTIREIDNKALELVREFGEAKGAVPPVTGTAGSVVIRYSSYTPKIVCRPMYVTDVILQPGEAVTGVHPGDAVRWVFVPSKSGTGDAEQIHVLIKPLAADISTNIVINTDRRTYLLDLISSAKDFMPSVSFSYPDDSVKAWDAFIAEKKKERESGAALASGYSV
ncbi:MAG: TrbG/VirB9 family P-type conjugative transfer protein, partial [Synergistaceae bacterium]|nr:TrbG/VirB9 family P-type conjugative transfer protein [Synergistaceae bacterium]